VSKAARACKAEWCPDADTDQILDSALTGPIWAKQHWSNMDQRQGT
jgi:hypothetical protein